MASAWTPGQIAAIVGCPEPNVWKSWPGILAALDARGIGDRPVQIAAIATVAVESSFRPVREAHWLSESERNAYLTRMYEGRQDLGNSQPGDGIRFAGRSFIQITGRSNYRAYGQKLGLDLISDPDGALDPTIAAKILAVYFTDHRIRWEPAPHPLMSVVDLARAGEWRGVRVAVNSGENGLARFLEIVNALGGARMPVKFNPNEPNIAQNDPWSCAPTSTRWALKALGRNPSEQWIEDTMLAEGVVTRELGLMDASGAGLAAFLKRHYGEFGFDANHEPSVSWDWCTLEGDRAYPVLIGGRGWNHWAALKGWDPTSNSLLLMNPSPGWMGIQHTMNRATFNALGSFSAVRLFHPDLFASKPLPPPPPDPILPPPPPVPTLAEVRRRLVALTSESDERIVGRYLRDAIAEIAEGIPAS